MSNTIKKIDEKILKNLEKEKFIGGDGAIVRDLSSIMKDTGWKNRTAKQVRAQRMNFDKFRLSGTRNVFANVADNRDLPSVLRDKAEKIVAEVVVMLELFPKHLPERKK